MTEVKDKSLWSIIKGTVAGLNHEGSSKRATSFYSVVILITSLDAAYIWAFIAAVRKECSQDICMAVIKMYQPILFAHFLFVLTLLGLATIEMITNLIKSARGIPESKPKEETPA